MARVKKWLAWISSYGFLDFPKARSAKGAAVCAMRNYLNYTTNPEITALLVEVSPARCPNCKKLRKHHRKCPCGFWPDEEGFVVWKEGKYLKAKKPR